MYDVSVNINIVNSLLGCNALVKHHLDFEQQFWSIKFVCHVFCECFSLHFYCVTRYWMIFQVGHAIRSSVIRKFFSFRVAFALSFISLRFFLFLFSLFFFLFGFQQTRKACITTELRIYLKANAIYIRTTTIFWSHSFTDKNAFSFSLLLNDFLSFGSECIVFIY